MDDLQRQREKRVAESVRASIKEQIDRSRTPAFMARLARRMREDKRLLERLHDA